jgi:phospholipase C
MFGRRSSFIPVLCVALVAGCSTGAPVGPYSERPSSNAGPAYGVESTAKGSAAPAATATPVPSPSASASAAACSVPIHLAGVNGPAPGSGANSPVGKIEHIVIIIQENRTFDNIFHGFSEPSGKKADYADYGCTQTGARVALQSVPFESQFSPGNGHADFFADYDNGKNDGFYAHNAATATDASAGNNGLAYLPQTEVQPYFDMATNGALAERFFHGVTGPTYASHLMFTAASTTYDGSPRHRVVGNASGSCSDPTTSTVQAIDLDDPSVTGVIPCYTGVTTINDLLDDANDSWAYYSFPVAIPLPGQAANVGYGMNGVPSYAQDYAKANFATNDITPSEKFLTDVASGTLADVTWVTPDQLDSDHPAESTAEGPAWVQACVDAVGESPFYSSTAIFVTWDDFGGLYDHVPPPQKYKPWGLSFRIPLIAISPYARAGELIDTQLEPGSLIKFIEETFGLPSLGREDETAKSLDDMFDFAQAPKSFTPILSARYPASHFLNWKPSYAPVDTDELGPGHT